MEQLPLRSLHSDELLSEAKLEKMRARATEELLETLLPGRLECLKARPDGTIATVYRKGYTKRSGRADVWRYHLKEVAMAEEPLRYMRRYLRVEDELDPDPEFDAMQDGIEEDAVPPEAVPTPAKKAGRPVGRPRKGSPLPQVAESLDD